VTNLLPFACTTRVLDLADDELIGEPASPLGSCDVEHAAARTFANAASLTPKPTGDTVRPLETKS